MSLKKYAILFSALMLVIGSSATSAVLVPAPTGTVEIPAMDMLVNFNYTTMSTVTDNPDGVSKNFDGNDTNSIWIYDWNFDADADPFIDAMLTFQNLTGVTQSFVVALNLPASPPFSPGLKRDAWLQLL